VALRDRLGRGLPAALVRDAERRLVPRGALELEAFSTRVDAKVQPDTRLLRAEDSGLPQLLQLLERAICRDLEELDAVNADVLRQPIRAQICRELLKDHL
jgi:hypothetical protein